MRARGLIGASVAVALAACAPPRPAPKAAEQPAPAAAAVEAEAAPAVESGWTVPEGGVWRLVFQKGERKMTLQCEEGRRELRLTFFPAWTGEGPFMNAKIKIGALEVPAKADPRTALESQFRPAYVIPANAETVTAVMMADNVSLSLPDGSQTRSGDPDASGAFDLFATTCAQINGLR